MNKWDAKNDVLFVKINAVYPTQITNNVRLNFIILQDIKGLMKHKHKKFYLKNALQNIFYQVHSQTVRKNLKMCLNIQKKNTQIGLII